MLISKSVTYVVGMLVNLPSIAMQRTTFSPRCCCRRVSFASWLVCCGGLGVTYGDLEHELGAVVGGLKGVQNWGQLVGVELDCEGVSEESSGGPEALLELRVALTDRRRRHR